jgi:hypothetical protein
VNGVEASICWLGRLTVPVAIVVLALSGCGGAGKPASSAATGPTPPSVTPPQQLPPAKAASYNVTLAGFTEGSPNGSGHALITINAATDELCWQFSQLKNVTAPTVARIYRSYPGSSGRYGLPLGSHYKSSGCVHETSRTLRTVEANPGVIYLSIHDAQFPDGAVRGPL